MNQFNEKLSKLIHDIRRKLPKIVIRIENKMQIPRVILVHDISGHYVVSEDTETENIQVIDKKDLAKTIYDLLKND